MKRRTSYHYDQAIIKLSNSPNHRLILSILCPYCESENGVMWEGKLKENWYKFPNWPSVHNCGCCGKAFNLEIRRKKLKIWYMIAKSGIDNIFWEIGQRYIIRKSSGHAKGRKKKIKKSYLDIIRRLRYWKFFQT